VQNRRSEWGDARGQGAVWWWWSGPMAYLEGGGGGDRAKYGRKGAPMVGTAGAAACQTGEVSGAS
jgi:hypothetical protein